MAAITRTSTARYPPPTHPPESLHPLLRFLTQGRGGTIKKQSDAIRLHPSSRGGQINSTTRSHFNQQPLSGAVTQIPVCLKDKLIDAGVVRAPGLLFLAQRGLCWEDVALRLVYWPAELQTVNKLIDLSFRNQRRVDNWRQFVDFRNTFN